MECACRQTTDKEIMCNMGSLRPCEMHAAWMRSEIIRPVPMILFCPQCGERHIDVGEFETKHHHTHACQYCGFVWRPAVDSTVGVQFLPGFKNEE